MERDRVYPMEGGDRGPKIEVEKHRRRHRREERWGQREGRK